MPSLYLQASDYFGVAATDPAISSLADNSKVNNFLDDGNALVLTANLETRQDGEVRVHLDNLPSPGMQDTDKATYINIDGHTPTQ